MELAIPLVALGGMYVISNQNNASKNKSNMKKKGSTSSQLPLSSVNRKKESFTNMGRPANYLPNTEIPLKITPLQMKKSYWIPLIITPIQM